MTASNARAAVALIAAVAGSAAGAPAAIASPGSGPTAIVSMGDSYISGQGGRWQGNSIDPSGDRAGTDRACVMTALGCNYDENQVYLDGSGPNNCHRSDVAEIRSAAVPVAQKLNISCSGGRTKHIPLASRGGQSEKGEPPQGDQLLPIARASDVKLIVLSVGGNDIEFADGVTACVLTYVQRGPPCKDEGQRVLDRLLPGALTSVGKAIDEIGFVMRSAGYRPWDYRIVLQSYPSVLPRARENRYPEAGADRGGVGNCPFYDADSDWARDSVVPQIANGLKGVAAGKRVQFLDVRDAFQGREICSTSTRQADRLNPPTPRSDEWGRFVGQNSIAQGELEESFHPSAYGQMALGRCVALIYARPRGSWACTNTPGQGPEGMVLTQVSSVPDRYELRLRPSRRRVGARRRRRTCLAFKAVAEGFPVEGVTVRFARKRRTTGRRGRVRICARLRARRYRATASREGFIKASTRVKAVRVGHKRRRG